MKYIRIVQLEITIVCYKLNAVTRKDSYPLTRIDDCLDRLKDATIFSSLDCDQAYYQVPLNESDKSKTAFVTPDASFQWKVMPFGLHNAPATFSRLIDHALGKLKWTIALVYLDDIVVYSRTFDEHLVHLSLVFEAIRAANLKLKPQKCKLGFPELPFLGHIISNQGIKVNPDLTRAVSQFPTPTTVKKVQSFVSLCSYYRKFIEGFSSIAKPLTQLSEKGRKFIWDDYCQAAYDTLK